MAEPEVLKYAYRMGYDAGVNGSDEINCNFRIFATHESMKEWERGKAAGDAEKRIQSNG